MHSHSREKTVFVTRQGLYELTVVLLGLKNTPAVFQHLMNKVFMGLNPENGSDFVVVYLDDIVFWTHSKTTLHTCNKCYNAFSAAELNLQPSN